MGGDKALDLLEKALDDQDLGLRASAATALGQVGGDPAIQKALNESQRLDPPKSQNGSQAAPTSPEVPPAVW
jgi:hypothetical protein